MGAVPELDRLEFIAAFPDQAPVPGSYFSLVPAWSPPIARAVPSGNRLSERDNLELDMLLVADHLWSAGS
jgi:hypothetical protein